MILVGIMICLTGVEFTKEQMKTGLLDTIYKENLMLALQ